MEIIEKDLTLEQSDSTLVSTEDDVVSDITLESIIEEFNYLEILENA